MTRGQHRRPGQGVRERLAKLLAAGGTHRNQGDGQTAPVQKATDAAPEGRHRARGTAA